MVKMSFLGVFGLKMVQFFIIFDFVLISLRLKFLKVVRALCETRLLVMAIL